MATREHPFHIGVAANQTTPVLVPQAHLGLWLGAGGSILRTAAPEDGRCVSPTLLSKTRESFARARAAQLAAATKALRPKIESTPAGEADITIARVARRRTFR